MKKILCILLSIILAVSVPMEAQAASKKEITVSFYTYHGYCFEKSTIKKGKTAKSEDPSPLVNMDYIRYQKFVKWDKSLTKKLTKNTKFYPIYRECIPYVELDYKLKVGESYQVPTGLNNYTKFNVSWKSSNDKVATVDKNGKITAISEGTATIEYRAVQNKVRTYKKTLTYQKTYISKINITVSSNDSELSILDIQYPVYTFKSNDYPVMTIVKKAKVGETIDLDFIDKTTGDKLYYDIDKYCIDDETRELWREGVYYPEYNEAKIQEINHTFTEAGIYSIDSYIYDASEKMYCHYNVYYEVTE